MEGQESLDMEGKQQLASFMVCWLIFLFWSPLELSETFYHTYS